MKEKSILSRIANMSHEEGANLLANLRLNAIPPYRIHTHPSEFTVHAFGVDCEARVNSNTPDSRRAMHDLGMDRVREIANTVYLHPTLGEDALNAMLDGKRVIINVQRHPKMETKPSMPAVSVKEDEVVAPEPEMDTKYRTGNSRRNKQRSAVSRAMLN